MTDSATNPQIAPESNAVPTLQPSSTPPASHWLANIFVGPEGLRPGWGLLLYVALFRLLILASQGLLRPNLHHLDGTVWHDLVKNAVIVFSLILPAFVMSRIEKRPFGSYGLAARGAFGTMFTWGLVWGFVALSMLLAMLRGAHAFYFGSLAVHGTRAFKFALFWAVFFLLVGLVEELLFRGYAQFTLGRGIGFWPTAVLLSALFGYAHLGNPGESWRGALSAGLIGFFFCFTLARTGSLWFAVGLHAAWDWAESYFYGVPDSGGMSPGHLLSSSFHGPAWLTGGSVGPEGSVLVFVVIGALFVAFHVLHPASVPAQLTADYSR